MSAAAVLYVGDLDVMRAFYEECFGLAAVDVTADFCSLVSEAWMLRLVRSAQAVPNTVPPQRRASTPIKLAFAVTSIDGLRPVIGRLGGRVDLPQAEWEFQGAVHCDCVDPEGNVVQLVANL
jgi:predicted enzyme related to lactoylglutathione lyase